MYIGEISINCIIDDRIYIKVKSKDNEENIVICKNDSIVALCDPGFNTDNNIPVINRFSYDEVLDNINKEDEKDLWFDIDLRYICGISVI